MTTAQAAPNGPCVCPPDDATSIVIPSDEPERGIPHSAHNVRGDSVPPPESPISDLPSLDGRPFAASAYHVPPEPFRPSPNPRRPHEYSEAAKRLGTLPHRCQFMFSDGRQCTMARSDIHPSLCVYHSEREEQLFGDPFAESHVRGRTYDLPELFSAARDLTTARGVHRALAQVFRLLAQRRISRQEAATFAKLGHLLLQSISAMRLESADPIRSGFRTPVESAGLPEPEIGVPSFKRSAGDFSPASLALKSQTLDLPSPATAPAVSHDEAPATMNPPPAIAGPTLAAPAGTSAQRKALTVTHSCKGPFTSAEPSEVPQHQQLREIHPEPVRQAPQLPQNQHIQKCAT